MSDDRTVLDLARILLDAFDDIHDSFEGIMTRFKGYHDRLESLPSADVPDPNMIKKLLEELPQERATALMAAFMALPKLVPSNDDDIKEKTKELEEQINMIESIRSNLHTALDGWK